MDHTHHSLRYALTRTILVWAGIFFTLLGIIFLLTFDDLRSYTLQKVAEYRLNYQTREFAKHLRQKDKSSIKEESDALVQDPEVAGIVLIDASGELLHTSIHDDNVSLKSFSPITASGLIAKVYNTPHLHLFQGNIPDSTVKLYLVLDDRPITRAIHTSTLITGLLLLTLLLLSIFALHRVLRRQLVEPLEQLRGIMSSGETMPDKIIEQMEHSLPTEAGDILDTYDHLVHIEQAIEKRFYDMLDRVPGCVWSASVEFKYIDVSSRAMQIFNCPILKIKGADLWAWLPYKKQRSDNLDQLLEAIKSGALFLELIYSIRIDSQEQWFEEDIALDYETDAATGQKRLRGIFGISNNITRRKSDENSILSMQQQARKMEAVGTLVGGIAHEFNNMLAGIIGNVFLLKTEVEEGTKSAERLARIERLSNRASDLVDQLLAFGRKHRISVHDVSLVPLLQQVYAIESAGLPPRIKLNLDISRVDIDKTIVVRADASLLKQVLTSLLSNAADACMQKTAGEVTIEFCDIETDKAPSSRFPHLKDKDLLCLCVRDNGSGIRNDLLDRVFDPFFTTKEVGQGTGMGLSMVYGLMEGFGGAVELRSEESSGTSVYLYLQKSKVRPDNHERRKKPPLTLQYGQGETVLVADDEALLREAAFELLEKLRYNPVVVEDGQAALDYFQEHADEVAIVLLDLIMPQMGGAEAASRIRQINPELPIVFLTGYNLSEIGSHDLQLPNSRIVTKPYQIAYLSQAMADLLHPQQEQDA